MSTPKAEPLPQVRSLNPRAHLDKVVELEAAASADRTRIYDGTPWGVAAFRTFLQGGRGFVAINPHGSMVGFTVFSVQSTTVFVAKLVCTTRLAEDALHAALWETTAQLRREFLNLPMILDVG